MFQKFITHNILIRFELDALQTKVNVERERYQAAAQSQVSVVSAIPKLHINDRLTLSAVDASYLLRYVKMAIFKRKIKC